MAAPEHWSWGGGQSRAEGASYLGGSGGMLPLENFEIGNPWNAISRVFRVILKWILKILKQLNTQLLVTLHMYFLDVDKQIPKRKSFIYTWRISIPMGKQIK